MILSRFWVCGLVLLWVTAAPAAQPLRVFIRAGAKTHGPGQHDHPRFLEEWRQLLIERGAQAEGALQFPTGDQLDNTDVLVIYAAEGGTISESDRTNLTRFLRRGGGVVVLHDGVCGTDPQWFKTVVGGAWEHGHSKWLEGEVGIYFVDTEHPISRGISNFDWKDEIYYDLHLEPGAHVLATSFHNPFVIAPQLWTYEQTLEGGSSSYRAFVSLPGHEHEVFNTPHYRAILLRGIAWAGRQENVDILCRSEELGALMYPPGGPAAPEQAHRTFQVHPEFNLSLVAAEPLIEKVISLDWDAQGRLWVAETPEYPSGRTVNPNDSPVALWRDADPAQIQGGKHQRPARDRIAWLEDTDGDGRMDRKEVFYEGLELVTSLVFYKDGVIVTQAPDILWVRDTDGDGRAERVETVFTGFGTGDTHATPSNLRWGLDGWIYSAIGYSAGNPASPDGSRNFGRITAGIFRFKPDGSALEQVASGSCNTWGMDFTDDHEIIYTTATCGQPICHVVMPEWSLARANIGGVRATASIISENKVFPAISQRRIPYVQIDWVGQFTAAAGSCCYNGGAWPAQWNNSHFVSETTVNLVHHEFLIPQGLTYQGVKETGREQAEFLNSTDLWFRPIHQRIGPDGALYIVDFYNQAAVHNDTRGPRHGAHNAAVRPDRDHRFARLWRLQHKQSQPLPQVRLAGSGPNHWIRALSSPNGWARQTAHRLISEHGAGDELVALAGVAMDLGAAPTTRLTALWTLHNLQELDEPMLLAALQDPDTAVRKNALQLAAQNRSMDGARFNPALRGLLADPNGRVRLLTLLALQNTPLDDQTVASVVEGFPSWSDPYLQSAALGIAARDPMRFLAAALKSDQAGDLTLFVRQTVGLLARDANAAPAAALVPLLAESKSAPLKQAALESLAAQLKVVPNWTPNLQDAFARLLAEGNSGVVGAVLPLAARWDEAGSLRDQLRAPLAELRQQLNDPAQADSARVQVAVNLLGVRQLDPDILPEVARLLGSGHGPELRRAVIEALGGITDPAAGTALLNAFPSLPFELREAAFAEVVKRTDWSSALLDQLAQQRLDLRTLGPAAVHRLRTHPDAGVAERARRIVAELRGPEEQEKEKLVAQFLPAVHGVGDVDNGRKLYDQNCGVCHPFRGQGRDLAPDLTGMGVHGAHDLLVHILDPNRVVEPNFLSVSIETRDGDVYDGIVVGENRRAVTMRNATGDFEVPTDAIKERRSTARSLMPEGFEALGPDGLRDIITYISQGDDQYRVIDLTTVFTASSLRGIYYSEANADDTLRFRQYGLFKTGEVPFDIVNPQRTENGNNLLVLKGGEGLAKTYPQRVEVDNLNVSAKQLHFLGGIGGWAWPFGGDPYKDLPVLKIIVHFAEGPAEELIFRNGIEFADWISPAHEVPGSQLVPRLVRRGQVRWFSKELSRSGLIRKLVIESYDNRVAPTLVAITAQN